MFSTYSVPHFLWNVVVSRVVLGVEGSKILSVTDVVIDFGGHSAGSGGSSGGSSYVLLPLFVFTCVLTVCS
jgi:hypothetical protein